MVGWPCKKEAIEVYVNDPLIKVADVRASVGCQRVVTVVLTGQMTISLHLCPLTSVHVELSSGHLFGQYSSPFGQSGERVAHIGQSGDRVLTFRHRPIR